MANNSDYNKPRTNLLDLLPRIHQSSVNRSVFETIFNRFFTKTELSVIVGTIGKRNLANQVNTQLREPTVSLQANQLQPVMYKRVATVDHIMSFHDVLRKAEQIGIDVARFPKWGNSTVFNFVPPINIDKLVNFRDYYWFDPLNPNSKPQYITIESHCQKLTAQVNEMTAEVNYMISHEADEGEISAKQQELFDLTVLQHGACSQCTDGFGVGGFDDSGGYTDYDPNDNSLLNVPHQYDTGPRYALQFDGINQHVVVGNINLFNFGALDSFTVEILLKSTNTTATQGIIGKASNVSNPGWIIRVVGGSVQCRIRDGAANIVSKPVSGVFDGSIHHVAMVINRSTQLLTVYLDGSQVTSALDISSVGDLSNSVSMFIGRNAAQYYDGIADDVRVWNTARTPLQITNNLYKKLSGNEDGLIGYWKFDEGSGITAIDSTTNDNNGTLTNGPIYVDSLLPVSPDDSDPPFFIDQNWNEVDQYANPNSYPVTGVYAFDFISSCNVLTQTEWEEQNKWMHKRDVPNIAIATRAAIPIIEYQSTIELNEWNYTTYNWSYRNKLNGSFIQVNVEPSSEEIVAGQHEYNNDFPVTSIGSFNVVNDTITVFNTDATEFFPIGLKFTVIDTGNIVSYWTVDNIELDGTNTVITTVEDLDINVDGKLSPISETSSGDPWRGFFFHWLFRGKATTVPTGNLTLNPDEIYEEITVGPSSSVSIFELSSLTYLTGNNDIRVYINGTQQYGTYEEGTSTSMVFTPSLLPNETGDAINFFDPVTTGSSEEKIVKVVVSPASVLDLNKLDVMVRVDEIDNDFISNGPERTSLVAYRHADQIKNQHTQYPLFNLYKIDGTSANEATPIFEYVTSLTGAVDTRVSMRLETDATGLIFNFRNTLVNPNTNALLCYIDNTAISPDNPQGLRTAWRRGTNNDQYVPRLVNQNNMGEGDTYVDTNGAIQTVTFDPDESVDWEISDQFYHNANHELRSEMRLDHINAHFRSIISNQEVPPGFVGARVDLFRTLDTPNFGVGGNIKEFSDGFDTFLSSMFVQSGSPLAVIEFAKSHYKMNHDTLRDMLENNIVDLLSDLSDPFIVNLEEAISSLLISRFELNDAFAVPFGDSTTYNYNNDKGIKGWIATLPYVKLSHKRAPHILRDESLGLHNILFHDGHEQPVLISDLTIKRMVTHLQRELDAVVGPTGSRPGWPDVIKGSYFYDTSLKKLQRFNVVSDSNTVPDNTLYPNGTYYFNSETGLLYVHSSISGDWELVNGTPGSISDAWFDIDINEIYTQLVLEVETRLYEQAPVLDSLVYYPEDVIFDGLDQLLFDEYLEQEFLTFARKQSIFNPYDNNFDLSNAFTWNYRNVDVNNVRYPTTDTTSEQPWGASWYDINVKIFGTPYPHLQPWILQGYIDKPDWWDEEYKVTNGSRRWVQTMWTNMTNGVVPIGNSLPSGEESTGAPGEVTQWERFSVNIYNTTTTDGFGPDDLLPPYYRPVTGNPEDINARFHALIDNLSHIPQHQINEPFTFGEMGPNELIWRKSTDYLYDVQKAMFRIQPVRYLHNTIGIEYIDVDGLHIDPITERVYTHQNTLMHGDIINNNEIYHVHGLNQWYVHYHRYKAFDVNISDFRQLWASWNPALTYQTSSFIDIQSLQLTNDSFDISPIDYSVKVKETKGFKDIWVDSLNVRIQQTGSYKQGKNDISNWIFRVDAPVPATRPLYYYNAYRFEVTVDYVTDTFSLVDLYRTIPWETGQPVNASVAGRGKPPTGLTDETTYFIIKVSDTTFKLASSINNAFADIAIDITSIGEGQLYIEQVVSTFNIYANIPVFKHIAIDKRADNLPIPTSFPIFITGLQNVIDFIDGYAEYNRDQGIIFNDTALGEQDPETGRLVSWQVEIERFIRAVYAFGGNKFKTTDDILEAFYFEINPMRNNVWVDTPQGIISDVSSGPFKDIRIQQGIYDQYGRAIDSDNIFVLREDNVSRITIKDNINNDVKVSTLSLPTPYDNLHIGGGRLFLNSYEHVIMFNNYTLDDILIYDPFLGFNVNVFNIKLERQPSYTLRPNIGGYFLHNRNILPNIENAVSGINNFYDTFQVNELRTITKESREILGFASRPYYQTLNITPKSEFVFWRGLIQQKGTISSVRVLSNLRSLTDITIDDYWAYKIATFGDSREKEYYNLKIDTGDVLTNNTKFHFTDTVTSNNLNNIEDGFIEIAQNSSKWFDRPEQQAQYLDGYPNYFFNAEISDIMVNPSLEPATTIIKLTQPGDGVYITFTPSVDTTTVQEIPTGNQILVTISEYVLDADNLVVFINGLPIEFSEDTSTTIYVTPAIINDDQILTTDSVENIITVDGDKTHIFFPEIEFDIIDTDNNNGTYTVSSSIYDSVNDVTIIATVESITDTESDIGTITNINVLISVSHKTGTLLEDIHYTRINSLLVDFDNVDYGDLGDVSIYILNPAYTKHNPGKLIDHKSRVIKNNAPFWDPAREQHYAHSLQLVDIRNDSDPASYTFTLDGNDIDGDHRWNEKQVGTVWWNTNNLGYVPYYDAKIFPSYIERNQKWGKLSDWSDIKLYQWTESPVHPSLWASRVRVQEGNAEISQDTKASGTPLTGLYARTRASGNDPFGVWEELVDRLVHVTVALNGSTTIFDTTSIGINGDIVNFYINGRLEGKLTIGTNQVDASVLSVTINTSDFVTIVNPVHVPTAEELSFDPDVNDDGITLIQYKYDYKYSSVVTYAPNQVDEITTYYFWVTRKTTRTEDHIHSLRDAETYLKEIPSPFLQMHRLLPVQYVLNGDGQQTTLPHRYSQIIIRGFAGIIDEDNRYTLQLVRDFTLRSDFSDNNHTPVLKNVHEEWLMFREKEDVLIPRELWDKVTEAIVGYKLTDNTVLVPSNERILYDTINGTDTRYGMEDDQAFTNSFIALDTIERSLRSSSFNIFPINKGTFLTQYQFNTKEEIINSMAAIYQTLPPQRVNELFFNVLRDAFITKKKLPNIFKTSFVSLQTTVQLNVNGRFG